VSRGGSVTDLMPQHFPLARAGLLTVPAPAAWFGCPGEAAGGSVRRPATA